MLWSCVSEDSFCFRIWDKDEFAVVYIVANGDTHLVDLLALELLRLIQISPRTAESLALSLTEFNPGEEDDMALQSVEETLLRLLDVGLVACT